LGLLLLAAPASASDGRIEINQAKVLASGGFPLTISQPGSYVLTGNLDVRSQPNPANVTAIWFVPGSEGSTLDLGGFSLIGPRFGCAYPCPGPSGFGEGVTVGANFVSIVNGAVQGFGQSGVSASGTGGGTFERLVVRDNGHVGIWSLGHRIVNCESSFNANFGFVLNYGYAVGSRAFANGAGGWSIGYSVVERSSAYNNGVIGFKVAWSTLVQSHAEGSPSQLECFGGASGLIGNSFLGVVYMPHPSCIHLTPSVCGNGLCP
jgi:hypothetical protein